MTTNKKQQLVVVLGPTASGKTGLGITLACSGNGAIICADSRQVYAGMNIGTAKPPEAWKEKPHDILLPDQVKGVDHYLLNIREPTTPLTLFEWQQAAFKVIDYVAAKKQRPILVGGTMLYIDSVAYNYALPEVPADPLFRQAMSKRSAADLFAELLAVDSAAAGFIEPGNTRRIIRALEVRRAMGRSFSSLRAKKEPRYDVRWLGIFSDWDDLRERIKRRTQHMLTDGFVQEVQRLQERYGDDLPLLRTLGYRQILTHLTTGGNEDEVSDAIVQATMRYARRQMSWWRRNTDITWSSSFEELAGNLFS